MAFTISDEFLSQKLWSIIITLIAMTGLVYGEAALADTTPATTEYFLDGQGCPFPGSGWMSSLNGALVSYPTYLSTHSTYNLTACGSTALNYSTFNVISYAISDLTITTQMTITPYTNGAAGTPSPHTDV